PRDAALKRLPATHIGNRTGTANSAGCRLCDSCCDATENHAAHMGVTVNSGGPTRVLQKSWCHYRRRCHHRKVTERTMGIGCVPTLQSERSEPRNYVAGARGCAGMDATTAGGYARNTQLARLQH